MRVIKVYPQEVQDTINTLTKEVNKIILSIYHKYEEALRDTVDEDIIEYRSLLDKYNLEVDEAVGEKEKMIQKLLDDSEYRTIPFNEVYFARGMH